MCPNFNLINYSKNNSNVPFGIKIKHKNNEITNYAN